MQIDRIEEMRLTRADDAMIAALLLRAFGEDFGNRSFHQQRHHLRLVMRDPQIVGHMALCFRDIRMGARAATIVGLAEVATDPDRQGQGIASALMKEAITEARATTADFFVLFGVRPMYAGHGFIPMPNSVTATSMYGAKTGPITTERDTSLMILPLGDTPWDDTALIDLMGVKF